MIEIDEHKAIELLRNSVKGNEDFVYDNDNGCFYERNGKCSCLVGAALFAAGVSIEQLIQMDYSSDGTYDTDIQAICEDHRLPEGLNLTENAVEVFAHAQSEQDYGHTWAEALNRAEKVYSEFNK